MALEWYALHSKPRKEVQVKRYLKANGIEVFHPTVRVNPVNPRSSRVRSLFPRYLFVYADLDEIGISALQWVPGAVGLVQFDGQPASVPDHYLRELRQRIAQVDEAGGLHLDGLKPGDPVRITSGPFAGYEAIFDMRLSGSERIQVLLQWLGRTVKTRVDKDAVERRR
jgi:transcription elongation factor/antiterminator RfaH